MPQTGLPIAEGYRWAALLAVGAAISLWAEAKQTREKAVVALAAAFGLALLSTYSQTERQPPYLITERPVIRAATRWAKPGQPLLCYGYLPLSALYYYPYRVLSVGPLPMEYIFPGNVSRWRDVWRPYEETEALLQSRPGWLGLAKEKDWRVLQARWPEHVRLLERVPPYVIFATMPAPGAKKAAPFFSSPKGRPQAKEQKRP